MGFPFEKEGACCASKSNESLHPASMTNTLTCEQDQNQPARPDLTQKEYRSTALSDFLLRWNRSCVFAAAPGSPANRLQSGFRPSQGLWQAATGVREG